MAEWLKGMGLNTLLELGIFFFSSRRRHTRFSRDWSSDVCSSDLSPAPIRRHPVLLLAGLAARGLIPAVLVTAGVDPAAAGGRAVIFERDVVGHDTAIGYGVAVDLLEDGLDRKSVV